MIGHGHEVSSACVTGNRSRCARTDSALKRARGKELGSARAALPAYTRSERSVVARASGDGGVINSHNTSTHSPDLRQNIFNENFE
jgi:hypothetical protein